MTRLRVGIDVSAIPFDPRGAGRYVLDLVAALARRDMVRLHLLSRTDDAVRWERLAPAAEIRPLVPARRPARLVWEQVRAPSMADRWGVDVYHGPHYTMPERARLPKVVTVHDLTFFDHPEWHLRSKVVLFRRAIRRAAAGADALVCVSDATARRLRQLLDPSAPVHVVPHGIDHARFRPAEAADSADDAARLARLGVAPPYVAFVGTVEPRKNLVGLLAAFEALADDHAQLRLVVAGGAGWGSGRFDAAVAASRHRDRVVRTGYVDDADVPALLRGAAAVAYPALEEGFGLPAIEALACGAPVVTTAGSVMDELAQGAAVTAEPTPAGLAEALAAVLGGAAGTDRRARGLAVAAEHTWDRCAAGHEDVYAGVAQRRR